ncbi:MAG: putative two-component system response regulator, partial [Conexibacter sp.]|nr:putative two-component system response regulator [Conexibacter sp.]
IRTGLRMVLDAADGMHVVGEAADGAEVPDLVARARPDVVLMDIRMARVDGIEATRRLVASGSPARVVILTTFDLDEHVHDALRAGASGFLVKDGPADELLSAVRAVAAGESLLSPSVTRRVIAELVAHAPPAPAAGRPAWVAELTPREREVLQLLARGHSNAEIAAALVVSHETIKTHVARVLQKTGARDRLQAVVAAYDAGVAGRTLDP